MAVVRTPASAATYTTLRSRIQTKVGDSSRSRYTTNQLDDALNDAMSEMFNELGRDTASVTSFATLTYTADAEQVALPELYAAAPLIRVEDITNALNPIELIRVDEKELAAFRSNNIRETGARGRRWTHQDVNIAIRPVPASDISLRVWYMANPYIVTADNDQHPLPVAHEELLVVGAAIRLHEIDGTSPTEMLMRHETLKRNFQQYGQRFRGPVRVARVRRYP